MIGVLEATKLFGEMGDSDETEEPYFVDVVAQVVPDKEVASKGCDPVLDLDIKPNEVAFV